jgi:hypothetical protein
MLKIKLIIIENNRDKIIEQLSVDRFLIQLISTDLLKMIHMNIN